MGIESLLTNGDDLRKEIDALGVLIRDGGNDDILEAFDSMDKEFTYHLEEDLTGSVEAYEEKDNELEDVKSELYDAKQEVENLEADNYSLREQVRDLQDQVSMLENQK